MINAPVITGLSGVFGATWADRWDINAVWSWDAGGATVGDFEIWIRVVAAGPDFTLWGTAVASLRAVTIAHVCEASESAIEYEVKLRFNNYTDPPGPFSEVMSVVLNPPPPAGPFLVKESGAGLPDANSYASAADGDVYHAGHLYATAWTGATVETKEKALVMASRVIDAEYQFGGLRAVAAQALQWPRENCPSRDDEDLLPANAVPKAVVQATCELARELIVTDRTAAPAGEGLKYYNDAGKQTGYDKSDTRPIIPAVVQALLAKFGSLIKAKSGAVRLVRT